MEKINKYKAFDGKIFDSEEQCLKYDRLVVQTNEIIDKLNPIPNNCDFQNGKGFIQQDKNIVTEARNSLHKLGNSFYGLQDVSLYWLGRYFDDNGDLCLYKAWGRLQNIDDRFRECGQGYYALHPEEGKQIKLN